MVLAGNSLNETTRDKEETAKAKYLTKVLTCLKNLYWKKLLNIWA